MARMNDSSPHCERWTNAKLMREARRLANLENFSAVFAHGEKSPSMTGDGVREATRLYRETWLNPILDEIERRFVKS